MSLPLHVVAALEYALDLPGGLEPVSPALRALLEEHRSALPEISGLAQKLRDNEDRDVWLHAGLWFATHAGDELVAMNADPRRLGRVDTLHFEEELRRDAVIAALSRGDALAAATLVGPECGSRSFWCPTDPETGTPHNAGAVQWPILERLVDGLQRRSREAIIEAQTMAASRQRTNQQALAPMRTLVRRVAQQLGISLRGRTPREVIEQPTGPLATITPRSPLMGLHRVRLRLTPPMPGHTIHAETRPLSGVITLILDDSSLRWTTEAATSADGIQDVTLAAWSMSAAQHPVELVICRNCVEVLRGPVIELRTRPLHDLVAPADVFAPPSVARTVVSPAMPVPVPAAAPPPPADPALAQLATVEPADLRAMLERLLRLGAVTEPEVFEAGGYRLMAALDSRLADLSRQLGFRYEIRADELGRVIRRVG